MMDINDGVQNFQVQWQNYATDVLGIAIVCFLSLSYANFLFVLFQGMIPLSNVIHLFSLNPFQQAYFSLSKLLTSATLENPTKALQNQRT